ncbi:TPA: helix-turn-helix domain-containing protein, partial [Citrobacter amalonaticus]|nr:helix-turn-helix domain-containing protein [Citrobacter amalonaticus]
SWPRAEQIIANALETTPEKIWPTRYINQPTESATECLKK